MMDPFVHLVDGSRVDIEHVDFMEYHEERKLIITIKPKPWTSPDDIDDIVTSLVDIAKVQVHNGQYAHCSIELTRGDPYGSCVDELMQVHTVESSIILKYPVVKKTVFQKP